MLTLFCTVIAALDPVKLNGKNLPIVNLDTMETSEPGVFVGGDLAGISETTVEAVNDGKTAAWHMHCHIQVGTYVTLCLMLLTTWRRC